LKSVLTFPRHFVYHVWALRKSLFSFNCLPDHFSRSPLLKGSPFLASVCDTSTFLHLTTFLFFLCACASHPLDPLAFSPPSITSPAFPFLLFFFFFIYFFFFSFFFKFRFLFLSYQLRLSAAVCDHLFFLFPSFFLVPPSYSVHFSPTPRFGSTESCPPPQPCFPIPSYGQVDFFDPLNLSPLVSFPPPPWLALLLGVSSVSLPPPPFLPTFVFFVRELIWAVFCPQCTVSARLSHMLPLESTSVF